MYRPYADSAVELGYTLSTETSKLEDSKQILGEKQAQLDEFFAWKLGDVLLAVDDDNRHTQLATVCASYMETYSLVCNLQEFVKCKTGMVRHMMEIVRTPEYAARLEAEVKTIEDEKRAKEEEKKAMEAMQAKKKKTMDAMEKEKNQALAVWAMVEPSSLVLSKLQESTYVEAMLLNDEPLDMKVCKWVLCSPACFEGHAQDRTNATRIYTPAYVLFESEHQTNGFWWVKVKIDPTPKLVPQRFMYSFMQ